MSGCSAAIIQTGDLERTDRVVEFPTIVKPAEAKSDLFKSLHSFGTAAFFLEGLHNILEIYIAPVDSMKGNSRESFWISTSKKSVDF